MSVFKYSLYRATYPFSG